MQTFKDFITEQFMIARVNMPQVDDIEKFVDFLDGYKGVGSKPYYGYVDHLKPLQAEGFDQVKIDAIVDDLLEDEDLVDGMKPIIVSSDFYIVDGHHRYLAALKAEVKFPYIVVYATSNKLLKLCYEFSSN